MGGLPEQEDAFNCGVGMIAAIAIILRSACVENPGQLSFDEQLVRWKEKLLHLELSCGEWYARFDCVLLALFIVITQLGKGSSHNLHMIERSLL